MPCSNPIDIRHEVLALAHGGMRQSAIAGCIGLTLATVNHILQRHATTRTFVPGRSMGAPRRPHLVKTDRSDRMARALTARVRNLYRKSADRKTINNWLLSCGYRAYRPTRMTLLTANHRRLCLEWTQRWQNLTVIFGDESRFQLYPVNGRLRVLRIPDERFQQRCQLIGSKLVAVRYTSGELFIMVPNRLLCSLTDTSLVNSTGAFCETP